MTTGILIKNQRKRNGGIHNGILKFTMVTQNCKCVQIKFLNCATYLSHYFFKVSGRCIEKWVIGLCPNWIFSGGTVATTPYNKFLLRTLCCLCRLHRKDNHVFPNNEDLFFTEIILVTKKKKDRPVTYILKRLPLFIRTVILMLNYYHPNDHILRPNDKGEGLKTENRGRHFAKVSDWLTTLMKWFSTTNSSESNAILTQLIHHKRSRRKLSTDKFCYDWLVATITVITDNMLIRNSFKVK